MFDEAQKATEEMFEQQNFESDNGSEMPEEESSSEQEDTGIGENAATQEQSSSEANTGTMMQEAVNTAEASTEALAQRNNELSAALARIEQLEETISQLSKTQEEKIVEEMFTPPTLDINGLAFADETTQKAEVEKFAKALSDYNRQQMMSEMQPFVDFSRQMKEASDRDEAIRMLAEEPVMKGITEMRPQLDRMIEGTPLLKNADVPIEEKYIVAFAMANGVNAMNMPQQTEQSVEDLMKIYNENPEFRDKVEQQRISELKKSQQVPPFSASSGAANAALNIKDKPENLEDAFERTKTLFGG